MAGLRFRRRHRLFAARIFFTVLLLGLAGGGCAAVLLSVHEYPLTRAAFATYLHGGDRFWRVSFAFMNEAGAGLRNALGLRIKRATYTPPQLDSPAGSRGFRQASLTAGQDDWHGYLALAHSHALGWGVPRSREQAAVLYRRARALAADAGEYGAWHSDTRQITVEAMLIDELAALRMLSQLDADLAQARDSP